MCPVCGRKFATPRIVRWTVWHEEVCRACYKWVVEEVYGVATPNSSPHVRQMPWPHGFYFQTPEAS